MYTSSADMTAAIFDLEQQEIVKKFKDHSGIVNSLAVSTRGPEFLASCSDDNYISVRRSCPLVSLI